jgi:peptidyl-dipeptidase A
MHRKNQIFKIVLFILVITAYNVFCQESEKDKMKNELTNFIKNFEAEIIPAFRNANLADFNASISGKSEDYQKAASLEVKLTKIYSNKEYFAKLKKIKDSGLITEEPLKRELDVLYNSFLGAQTDEKELEEIIKLQSEIENKFSTFRAEVNGKKLTDNEIEDILKSSTDTKELKNSWLASKKIANVVSKDVIKLIKMRNKAAKELGFNNFHEMSLKLSEQDPKQIETLFDELDNLTRNTFIAVKKDMDAFLAARYKIPAGDLMPWHYQNRFFQEAPKIYNIDLDDYYKDKDLVELTKKYYSGIGLPINDLVSRSDLFEKEGKYQHAYSSDIDKFGDIRVVCNVKPNSSWMGTLLHEFGHSAYDKNIDSTLPWSLRDPAHTFTTEAIAMLFGRFSSNAQWMKDMLGISKEEQIKIKDESFKSLRLEQLVFSRWVQVVYRFEKSMYDNPDQDLNKLWWDLVEKYQMIKRPENRNEPDWASKIHISSYPCYYHNYMLGELLASQLYYHISEKILKNTNGELQSFAGRTEVGAYLRKNVFAPGARYFWNDMIEKATGEKLTPKYYARQFVDEK